VYLFFVGAFSIWVFFFFFFLLFKNE